MPFGSSANTTRNPSSKDRVQVKFKKANFFFLALMASGGVIAAWFGAANITPYKALLQGSADELAKNGFIQGIYWIPIIGGIARSFASNVVWLAATIFWGFIQIVEILPGVLWRHQGFLSAVVRSHDGLGTVAVRDNDPKSIKSAKNALNKLVSGFLDHMFLYCIGAYLIDAAICCWYYPIMPGLDWQKTTQYLMVGQLKYVSWANVFGVFSTLFAVEIIIHVLISIYMLWGFVRRSN